MLNKIINYQPKVVNKKAREYILNDYSYEQYRQFIKMNKEAVAIAFFNIETNELLIRIDVDGHEDAARDYGILQDKSHLIPGWQGIIICANGDELVIFDSSAQFGGLPSQYKLDLNIALKTCFGDYFPDTPEFRENTGLELLMASIFGN